MSHLFQQRTVFISSEHEERKAKERPKSGRQNDLKEVIFEEEAEEETVSPPK